MDVGTMKAELQGVLHSTNLNQITYIDGVFNRAARQVLLDVDPQETLRILPLGTPIYDSVFDYPAPPDLKGNKVVDIRPQVNRQTFQSFDQNYNKQFDITKIPGAQPNFTVNFDTSIKSLRINAPYLNTGIILGIAAQPTNNNGTWTTGGTASAITTDLLNWVVPPSSVSCTLGASTPGAVGYMENSTLNAIDASTQQGQGTLFYWVYLPTASNFTNVKLRWGSSSSNYWEGTSTTTQQGTTFQNGWNLIAFPWSTATVTGSPNSASITYIRTSFTYNGTAMVGAKINNFVTRLGQIYQLEYYSKFIFRDFTTGAYQETVTDNSNLINLDTETYNLLFWQVALLAVQQMLGQVSTFDINFLQQQYTDALTRYRALYKSQITLPKSTYYNNPVVGYDQFLGRSTYNW